MDSGCLAMCAVLPSCHPYITLMLEKLRKKNAKFTASRAKMNINLFFEYLPGFLWRTNTIQILLALQILFSSHRYLTPILITSC